MKKNVQQLFNKSMQIPSYKDIDVAHKRIIPFINRTPVLKSRNLNHITGANLSFKCENFQRVGAFKYRGATNAIQKLTDAQARNGVVTHSSGNHAQALALASGVRGIPAYIVMPENSPKSKIEAVKSYGGNITFCEPTLEARETNAQTIIEKTGATMIHPYDNTDIIAGQGTAAKELIWEVGSLDIIIAPVGGGGLLSGTAISTKSITPETIVYAAEPEMANDAQLSFRSKTLIPSIYPNTLADGLRTSLSELTLSIILQYVDDILTAKEETIIKAMHMIWQRMKIIVEPSAAVPLAIILENPQLFENKSVGIILSGGNVDLDNLPF